MKRILITGANGMIGSSLFKTLQQKYELILVSPRIDRIEKYATNATIVKSELSQMSEWRNRLQGVFCVVHLAAMVYQTPKSPEDKKRFFEVNTVGTQKLYQACSEEGVKRFLFFSTNDVYHASEQAISEDTPVNPQGTYGQSKLLAEQNLLEMSSSASTAVCIFRPSSVYGENDKGSMNTLVSFCKRGVIPLVGRGENSKPLLYLKDLNQAVERYIEHDNNFNREVFNISSGNYAYKDIINSICGSYQFKSYRIYLPRTLSMHISSKVSFLRKLRIAGESKIISIDKAIRMLGYQAKYPLHEGLMDSKGYYLA